MMAGKATDWEEGGKTLIRLGVGTGYNQFLRKYEGTFFLGDHDFPIAFAYTKGYVTLGSPI